MDLSAVWREAFKACLHACMPFWEQQQEQREAEQKHTCSFFKENQLWIVSWDIIKSLLSWCALTWLVWIDYQLISGMSFTKTLILWQRLITGLQGLFHSVEWMIQSPDPHWPVCPHFNSALCFSVCCPSSYTRELFLNHAFVVNLSSNDAVWIKASTSQ